MPSMRSLEKKATAKPAPGIITPSAAVVGVSAPEVMVVSTLRHSAEVTLKRPSHGPRRPAESQDRLRIFREMRDRFADMLRPRVEKAQQELARGNHTPLLHIVRLYGPFGLSLLLHDRATLDTLEAQWFSYLTRKDPTPWNALIKVLQEGVPFPDTKLTPAERDAKKKERDQRDYQAKKQAIEKEVQRLQRVGFRRDTLEAQSQTGTSAHKAAAKKLLRDIKK